MFKKILIANRGEIACRIIESARRMGIGTVAVYSEADAEALFVREADEALPIGPAPSRESYLRIELILEACKKSGAEAVHPGYGFLSENAEFARALEQEGIVFIGPSAEAIAAMGDKIRSKEIARSAGVATVPGHPGVLADAEEALAAARAIGFPVMLKASAGGGGKGMRIALNESEVREGFRAAQSEARSSFGDERLFIEKYIENPRHIEIQVLGDGFGNIIHLFERECSIQRRHQKIIEEAPSPFLDAETREEMGQEAVALARAVGYRSAGTVEFIVDQNRRFYFVEMNTRLQVEHPVTECVTGLDLVALQIGIAAGQRLPLAQSDLSLKGSAIEARIYAEDPGRHFLPSIGRLQRYRPPRGEGLRLDDGVIEGGEITLYYDPMIAKLIAYGEDRESARQRLSQALDRFLLEGVENNIAFLARVVASERFAKGALSTDFIAEEFPFGFAAPSGFVEADRMILFAALIVYRRLREREASLQGRLPQPAPANPEQLIVLLDGKAFAASLSGDGRGVYKIESEGEAFALKSLWRPGEPLLEIEREGKSFAIQVERLLESSFRLTHKGVARRAQVLSPRAAELSALMPEKKAADSSRLLLSPMPGLLRAVLASLGQEVKAGEALAIVEAMKMENVLSAERDGVIAKIHAQPGDSLAVDQVILEFA